MGPIEFFRNFGTSNHVLTRKSEFKQFQTVRRCVEVILSKYSLLSPACQNQPENGHALYLQPDVQCFQQ